MRYKYSRKLLSQAHGGYDHDKDFIKDLLATTDKGSGVKPKNKASQVSEREQGMLPPTTEVRPTDCPNEIICSRCGQFHTNKVGEISKHSYYLKNTSKLILGLVCKVNQLSDEISNLNKNDL